MCSMQQQQLSIQLPKQDFKNSCFDSAHHIPSSQQMKDLQFDEISSTQPGCSTAVVYVNPPSSQLQVPASGSAVSPSISHSFPSSPYSTQFSYSKTPFTCDIHPSSTTLPPPPSYSSSVSILSPGVHEDDSALTDSTASSSLINGDPTTHQYVQQQPLQHHLHGGPPHSLPPPLVPVSHHQPSALPPPPLIPKAEPHSPACSSFTHPCSFSASSPGAPWWQLQHVGNASCDKPAVLHVHTVGPWSAPPVPVAAQPSFTYPPGTNGLRPISPVSPTCMPPPLSAPLTGPSPREPPGQLRHFDAVAMSWLPTADYFEPVQQQRRLRRMACTCPNCASGANSKATNPDGSPRKKQHACHYPNCSKVYGKTSHLRAHLQWHTGEKRFVCTECGKRFLRSHHLNKHINMHKRLREKASSSGSPSPQSDQPEFCTSDADSTNSPCEGPIDDELDKLFGVNELDELFGVES